MTRGILSFGGMTMLSRVFGLLRDRLSDLTRYLIAAGRRLEQLPRAAQADRDRPARAGRP